MVAAQQRALAERAAQIRERFYAGKSHREFDAGGASIHVSMEPATQAAITKRAQPCRQNEGWIAATASKALSLAIVISSAKVPPRVAEERMRRCDACPHCTVQGAKHYCGCCGCPRWGVGGVNSSLEYKVIKAGWLCPREAPEFGPWGPENDGLTTPV